MKNKSHKNIYNKLEIKKYIKIIILIIFIILNILHLKNYSNIKTVIDIKYFHILSRKMNEKEKLYFLFHLKNRPKNPKSPLIKKEKQAFLSDISRIVKKKISSIKYLYLTGKQHFGNFLISLNNAISICEIEGCKKIFIQYNNFIYINHTILNQKYQMSIEPGYYGKDYINQTIKMPIYFFFYYYKYIKPKIRLNLIKQELLKNLPKIKVNPQDLYIYIRSGDIFSRPRNNSYSQPPLCFYKKILNNFNFRKVFIISENKKNPIIDIILKKYSYVIYKKNPINFDISYIINSYNIVSATSSFLISIIKLNDNLKRLYEYDLYKLSSRFIHLHYSVYNFSHNYTIYKMRPSNRYQNLMYTWYNSPEQRKLMIKEKCKNNFSIS